MQTPCKPSITCCLLTTALFLIPASNSTGCLFADEKEMVVERNFSISSRSPADFATIDAGILPSGADVIIRINVGNSMEEAFKIRSISLGCTCMSGKAYGDVVVPGETVVLEIKLKVPTKSQKDSVLQVIRIDESETSKVQVGLRYMLGGAACFRVDSVNHNILHNSNVCEFKVPILVTAPSNRSDISVRGTGDLSSLSAKIIEEGGDLFVSCKAETPESGDFAWAGSLTIEDKRTGHSNSVPCFIGREDPIVVVPSVVRFKKGDKRWIANVILRDNRGLARPADIGVGKKNDAVGLQSDLSIGCVADNGMKLRVETKQISKVVFRVELELPESNDKSPMKLPSSLKWQFGWDGGISELSTAVVGL